MEEFYRQYQAVVMGLCFWGLMLLGGVALLYATDSLSEIKRKWSKLTRANKEIISLFLIGAIMTGVAKSVFTFSNGVRRAEPTYATNDTVHIEWTKDVESQIPDNAIVNIEYRPNTATNEEWGLLGQSTVNSRLFETTLLNATNYDFNVYGYWIPPEPVHTNGVWQYSTSKPRKFLSSEVLKAIPLRARIIPAEGEDANE